MGPTAHRSGTPTTSDLPYCRRHASKSTTDALRLASSTTSAGHERTGGGADEATRASNAAAANDFRRNARRSIPLDIADTVTARRPAQRSRM